MKIRDKIFSESLSSMQERLYQEDAHIDILLVKLLHAIKPEVVLHLGSFSHALLCSANLKKISDSEVLYLRHEYMDTGFLDADYINYISHVGLSEEITFIGANSGMFLELLKRKDIVPDMIVMDQYSEDISPLSFVWGDQRPCLIVQEKPLLSMNKLLLDSPELDILYHQKCLLATNDIHFVLPILFGDEQIHYSASVAQQSAPLHEENVFQRQEAEFIAPQQSFVQETPEFTQPQENLVTEPAVKTTLRDSFYAATPAQPDVPEQEYAHEPQEAEQPSIRESLRDSFYSASPETQEYAPQPQEMTPPEPLFETVDTSEVLAQPQESYSGINAENFDISSAVTTSSGEEDEFEEVPQEDTEEELERRKRLMERMRERQARIKAIKEEVAEEYGVPVQRHQEEDDYVEPEQQQIQQPQIPQYQAHQEVPPSAPTEPEVPQMKASEVLAQQATPAMPELPTEKTQEDIINAARRAIAMRRAMGDDAQ